MVITLKPFLINMFSRDRAGTIQRDRQNVIIICGFYTTVGVRIATNHRHHQPKERRRKLNKKETNFYKPQNYTYIYIFLRFVLKSATKIYY